MLKRLALLLLCLFSFNLACAATQQPIPPDQAFRFTVRPTNTDSVLAIWHMAPGYYLYKDRISFSVLSPNNALLGEIIKPQGIKKEDSILGIYYVYEKRLQLSVPIINSSSKPLKLLVHFQGCADWGFCYPPMTKLVTILNKQQLTANDINIEDYKVTSSTQPTAANSQSQAAQILQTKNSFVALLLFFGFGLLLAFTPCVLPMIPILSSIIIGQGNINTKRAFALSLAYVLGMAFAFAIAGLIVGLLGSSIQTALQTPSVLITFSILFIVLALSLFDLYHLRLPERLHQHVGKLHDKQKTGNYIGVAIMGALSTLIVSPCVSAPLVGALAYIGNTGNALFGGVALLVLGLGMGIPLLIIGTSFGRFLPKSGEWMERVKHLFGILMLGVAIWILERIIPAYISLALWGVLAIIAATFMDAFVPTQPSAFAKFCKGLGLALFVYGIVLIVGAAMGNSDLFQPIKLPSASAAVPTSAITFQPVKSIADVSTALQQNTGKIVMLDFYAKWCVACKTMDSYTFSNPAVQTGLKNVVLLRADVTANDATDQALEKKYGVIAPPTILFFDKSGNEISAARIVGEMNAGEFLAQLQQVGVNRL